MEALPNDNLSRSALAEQFGDIAEMEQRRGEGVFQRSAARWPEVISAMLGMGERCAVQVHFPYTATSSSVRGGDGKERGRDALFGLDRLGKSSGQGRGSFSVKTGFPIKEQML